MEKVSCSEEEYDKRLLSSAMEEEDKSASGTLAKVIKDHQMMRNAKTVSYTHLTLPTILLV